MRRFFVTALAAALLAFSVAPVSAAAAPRVTVNGSDLAIVLEKEEALVSVDALAKALGARLEVSKNGREVTLTAHGYSVVLEEGSARAIVNGAVRQAPVAMRKSGESWQVPARFVATALGGYIIQAPGSQDLTVLSARALMEKMFANSLKLIDQKTSGYQEQSVRITAEDMDGGSLTMNQGVTYDAQVYKNQMLATYKSAPTKMMGVNVPGFVYQLAVKDGKMYMKHPQLGNAWRNLGAFNPAALNVGGASIDAAAMQKQMLELGAGAVVGTETVNGVQLAKVEFELSETGFDDMIGNLLEQVFKGLLTGKDGPDIAVFVNSSRLSGSYLIDPATGFLYKSTVDLVIDVDVYLNDDLGVLRLTGRTGVESRPVAEPIQFPADLK